MRQKPLLNAFAVGAGVVWLLPPPLAYLVVIAVLRHWNRCDIGINASANSFTMLFFILPLVLVWLYVTGALAHAVSARRLGHRKAWAALPTAGAMVGMAAVAGWLLAIGPTLTGYPTYCIG